MYEAAKRRSLEVVRNAFSGPSIILHLHTFVMHSSATSFIAMGTSFQESADVGGKCFTHH